MANAGPNTNGSQFFLTFIPCLWLDGKHTVFGKLINGNEILTKLNSIGSSTGKAKEEVIIEDCGIVQ